MTDPTNTEETFAEGISRALVELLDRLKLLEGHVEFQGTEDNARIKALETRCTDLAQRITAETSRINKIREMHHEVLRGPQVLERITALENGSRLVGTGKLIAQIMDRLDALEGHPRQVSDEDFSPPIGGTAQRMVQEMQAAQERVLVGGVDRLQEIPMDKVRRAERSFIQAEGSDTMHISNVRTEIEGLKQVREESYSRGYSAGLRAGIEEVESRVDGLLEPWSIRSEKKKAIIEAIRAVVTSKFGVASPTEDMILTPIKDQPQA